MATLAIDIGNTNIGVGVFKKNTLVATWRLATQVKGTSDEYGLKILGFLDSFKIPVKSIQGIAIASVVPPLDTVFSEMSLRYVKAPSFLINSHTNTGIKIKYTPPQDVGADRIANAVAVFEMTGTSSVVVDFGTATTFDCVTDEGAYVGGAIVPGPLMAAEALFERTAKLPHINLTKPHNAIGASTVESIQSGLYFGYIGLIEKILDEIVVAMKKFNKSEKIQIIATGGLAGLFANDIKKFDKIEPNLTLIGINLIWNRNQKNVVNS